MKKLFTLGNVIPLFVAVFFTTFFVSCSKNSGGAGGGGRIEPNPTKPSISAGDPSKGWYDKEVSGTFTVTGSPDNLTVTATASDSGPLSVTWNSASYTVYNVVQRTTIKIVARNKYGADSVYTYGDVWDSQISNLFRQEPGTDGIFRLSAIQVDNQPVQTSGLTCFPIQFFADGSTKTYGGECAVNGGTSPDQWSLVGPGIRFGGQTYEKFTIITNKSFMVEFHNAAGQLAKRWFTKN